MARTQSTTRQLKSLPAWLHLVPPPFRLASLRLAPLLLTSLLLVLIGCTPRQDDATTSYQSFTDDLARTVSIKDPVTRVVTLAPSLTEVVFAAGAGDRVVGASTVDTYPAAVATLPRYSVFPIDFEAVAALAPDLVLATTQVNVPRDAETLAALDIPTVFLSFQHLDDVMRGIRTVGRLLGTAAAADNAADSLARSIAMLHARTDTLSRRPLVLFLVGDDPLFTFGKDSYIHLIIALAGGRSATVDFGTAQPVLSEAFVLTAQPDVIVGGFGADYGPARLLAVHPTWDVVPALRNGRVYSLDPDLFYRPGPRLVEGAWRLAERLHPALFAGPLEMTPEAP